MLELHQRYIDEMIAHAREDAPNECCGILAGRDGRAVRLYRMTNVEASPYRYKMSSAELLRTTQEIEVNSLELLAFYHSHTHTQAYPSPTDVRIATWTQPDGTGISVWPGTYYVLVSLEHSDSPVVRAFNILDETIIEEELRVTQQ